jgi:transposase
MDVHQSAWLTPRSRAELVPRVRVEGLAPKVVAAAFGVTVKTVSKWVKRFQLEGLNGLVDRSSRPHRLRQPTPEATVERIAALPRQRWTGDQIARQVGVSPATVSRVLRRLGLSGLKARAPAAPTRRGALSSGGLRPTRGTGATAARPDATWRPGSASGRRPTPSCAAGSKSRSRRR